MTAFRHPVAWLIAATLLAGCASSGVNNVQSSVGEEKIPRPTMIVVHDFAATPAGIPPDSAVAGRYAQRDTPQTPRDIEVGRRLGEQVAIQLVDEINKRGIPAVRAEDGFPVHRNDVVIRGGFVSTERAAA